MPDSEPGPGNQKPPFVLKALGRSRYLIVIAVASILAGASALLLYGAFTRPAGRHHHPPLSPTFSRQYLRMSVGLFPQWN